AIEGVAAPGRREVAPLHERPACAFEAFDRAMLGIEARTPERATNTLWWIFELTLQPVAEDFAVEPLGLPFRERRELRIEPRRDRSLAQEVRAEAVNRADVRLLEIRERCVEMAMHGVRGRARALDFETGAQTELQFAGRFLGERHGDDAIDRRAA